jgi:multicomponent Na+:H+ antiporter subunit D
MILTGAMETANWIALFVIVVSTVLNAAYFLPIVFRAFFRDLPKGSHAKKGGEAPWPIVAALTVTAAGTIVLFFAADIALQLSKSMIGQ